MNDAAVDARPGANEPLTEASLVVAVEVLTSGNVDLRGIVDRFGPPPLWGRPQGYPTLVKIILEQQVSLSSAQAAFDRLQLRLDPLTPAGFLKLTDAELLAIGFSRQKARYGRALAEAIVSGAVDLERLHGLDDRAVHEALQAVPGIGPWTAGYVAMRVTRAPDVLLTGDLALRNGADRKSTRLNSSHWITSRMPSDRKSVV